MSQVADDIDFLDYGDIGQSRPMDPTPIDAPIIDMRDSPRKKILGVEVGSKMFWLVCAAILIAAYLYIHNKK